MKKVLVALSGGVDSSVAAACMLEAGYAVEGAYIRTWMHEENLLADCPWKQDREQAQAAADVLGIRLRTVNLIAGYEKYVVAALVEGYRKGITPNPDMLCNRHIKFGLFWDYAQAEGFDALATGHYCRLVQEPSGYSLWEAVDKNKDQSYFLALVRPEILPFVHFPLGNYTKPQVRAKAAALGLPNAQRKDSQGICFLGKVPIQAFLSHYIPSSPGPIITLDGRVVGEHPGLQHFTLGQRRGIGVPSNTDNKAYVVVAKDLETNSLIVAFDEPTCPILYHQQVRVTGIHWLGQPITVPTRLLGKPRYRDPSQPLTYTPLTNSALVHFDHPQRALAPGQVLALYASEHLLGAAVYY